MTEAARLARREAALALRPSMSPPGRAPEGQLRIATWNLNSLRARLPAVARFLDHVHPDVLCLQETKAAQLSPDAAALFERHGYRATHVGANHYNGVAVLARHPVAEVTSSGDFGDEHLDREPRVATCVVLTPTPMRVVSVYVPHGREVDHWHYEYKLAFLDAVAELARKWIAEDGHLVIAGDINVAPTNSDVFHPDAFVGATHVTQRERDALARVLEVGLVDVDVAKWGERARRFTWWKPGFGYSRNLGMRIDMLAVDGALAERLETTWIDHTERGSEKPSDHAALVADFWV